MCMGLRIDIACSFTAYIRSSISVGYADGWFNSESTGGS